MLYSRWVNGKAPGKAGIIAAFYQQYCSIVGNSLTQSVLSFLNSGLILKEINKTTIVLIPKVSPFYQRLPAHQFMVCII